MICNSWMEHRSWYQNVFPCTKTVEEAQYDAGITKMYKLMDAEEESSCKSDIGMTCLKIIALFFVIIVVTAILIMAI